MLRSFTVFSTVTTLHFFASVLGLAFILPAAFETQGGAGFWAAPGKSILAWMPNVLLALLPQRYESGFLHIAAVSVMFGLAAVGLHYLWRSRRGRRRA